MTENERLIRHQIVVEAAHQMMIAARTAPKGKGCDLIEITLVSQRADLEALASVMSAKAQETGMAFLQRDADNILCGEAVLLIGTKAQPLALNCGYCGYPNCQLKPEVAPCAFNSIDVGIAVGSACSKAADLRLDTRVMFSAGWCSQFLDWMPGCHQTIAIAIGAASKNPFFDRKPMQ
ncbi:MAG: ferredoxin domain-containing protein [Muribaculaceae bacterium]